MLPEFDVDLMPFLVSTGNKSLNIVNVKTGFTQELIETPISAIKDLSPICFVKAKSGDFEMHFISIKVNEFNVKQIFWYKFHFKPDFVNLMRKYGRVPFNTIEDSLIREQQIMQTMGGCYSNEINA